MLQTYYIVTFRTKRSGHTATWAIYVSAADKKSAARTGWAVWHNSKLGKFRRYEEIVTRIRSDQMSKDGTIKPISGDYKYFLNNANVSRETSKGGEAHEEV